MGSRPFSCSFFICELIFGVKRPKKRSKRTMVVVKRLKCLQTTDDGGEATKVGFQTTNGGEATKVGFQTTDGGGEATKVGFQTTNPHPTSPT